jgi:hypothetical protein
MLGGLLLMGLMQTVLSVLQLLDLHHLFNKSSHGSRDRSGGYGFPPKLDVCDPKMRT